VCQLIILCAYMEGSACTRPCQRRKATASAPANMHGPVCIWPIGACGAELYKSYRSKPLSRGPTPQLGELTQHSSHNLCRSLAHSSHPHSSHLCRSLAHSSHRHGTAAAAHHRRSRLRCAATFLNEPSRTWESEMPGPSCLRNAKPTSKPNLHPSHRHRIFAQTSRRSRYSTASLRAWMQWPLQAASKLPSSSWDSPEGLRPLLCLGS